VYSVAILGLGHIGQEYDYSCALNDASLLLSHASAFYHHPDFELIAGVDASEKQRLRFAQKYQKAVYATYPDLLAAGYRPEIVVLATPTASHYSMFQQVFANDHKPKLIVCEKPFSGQPRDAEDMVARAKAENCKLCVNFYRRYVPAFTDLKKALQQSIIGEPYKAIVKYTKGVKNNASHFVDLLSLLFDVPDSFGALARDCSSRPFDADADADVDFYLHFKNGLSAYFLYAYHEHFSVSEFEIIGTKGSCVYNGEGRITIASRVPDSLYSDYQILGKQQLFREWDHTKAQWYVVNHVKNQMNNQDLLHPSECLDTISMLDCIVKEALI